MVGRGLCTIFRSFGSLLSCSTHRWRAAVFGPLKNVQEERGFSRNNHKTAKKCPSMLSITVHRIMSKPENIGDDAANPSRLSS